MVVILKIAYLVIALVFIAGCAQANDFAYGMKKVNDVNLKYNTTMETYPKNIEQINFMLNDFAELKKLQLDSGQEQLNYVIDYRILNLEAEKLYIEGQRHGAAGTTRDGFGCKSRPIILESARLRNKSASKGFESVDLVREFAGRHPKESGLAGLSSKNALFLNATFYGIAQEANRDVRIINYFCPENVTLEIYQQDFRKRTNLSEDFIKNLDYDGAVKIWKNLRGIN